MNINFEHYKVFYHVATTLSFSKASAKLYISQSAVSQSIKILEEKLQTTLFHRSTKKVTLTHEGTLLLQHIEPAIHLIHHGENNILANRSLQQGKIRIGASDTICKHILLPYFQQFHQNYPGIHLQVTNRTSLKCVQLLKQGSVDFIITNLPNPNITATMTVEPFYTFHDIFIAGTRFKHLRDTSLSLEEVSSYPLLMLEKNTTTSQYAESFFTEHHLNLQPEVELTSIDLLVELAKINIGISLVPDYCIKKEPIDKIFPLKLQTPFPKRQLAIVTHKSVPLSVASKTFMDHIKRDK